MSDEKSKVWSLFKDIMAILSPFLTLLTVLLAYFSFYSDVLKEPQLNLKCKLEKTGEIDSFNVVKISVEVQNKSKTTVYILGLMGQLLGKVMNPYTGSEMFGDRIKRDTIGQSYLGYYIEADRNLNYERRYYEAICSIEADRKFIQPEEVYYYEKISLVPKYFKAASFEMNSVFVGKDVRNPLRAIFKSKNDFVNMNVPFTIDTSGSVDFDLHNIVIDKDTLCIDDNEIMQKHGLYTTSSKAEIWLYK